MTRNGWCRTNYHSDGKRRWDNLTNGLCSECQLKGTVSGQVTRLQQKINDLEFERDRINCEIDCLRSKVQTLVESELIEL